MTPIVDHLLRDPVLAKCDYTALSRLLPYIEERSYAAGELLYRAGEPADGLFLLTSGEARLHTPDGETHGPGYARFGEESATDANSYLADAIVVTPLTALYIPRASLLPLLAAQPSLKTEFMFALMGHTTGNQLQIRPPAAAAQKKQVGVSRLIGWLVAIALPLIVLLAGAHYDMDRSATMFVAIFSATVTMWMFSLVDDYVPGLFAVMAILIAGLVPTTVVLAGFASDGFLMAMSILGLSTVIVSSGLGYRAMLLLLHHLPNSRFWHNFGLAMTGFFLTPLIPSINGRVSLVMPFYVDMVQNLRFTRQREAATQLMVSAFTGVSLFSAMFLSSKTVNFAVFGLLPVQLQDRFQGFKWLIASGVAALVLLAAYALSAALLFGSDEKPRLCKERVVSQLELLGRLKHREWAALLGVAVFILGMLTASLHHISPPWLGLAILYGLLLFGSLSKKELKEKIDWPFLLYLSGLTGMVSAFNHLGLDRMLAAALPGLGAYMRDSFGLFVLMLFGVIFVIRLAVPISATIVILATLFIPLAEIYGVNPWVVGFVILVLGEVWFLPYQCSYYLQLQALNRSKPHYREKSFLLYNGVMNFARLAAIYASIPYWKAMGLL
ncbi:MAG: SLC13 family permease [Sulfuricellaceae bacterium]